MTETDVLAALAKRFPAPTYALIAQVRNATGFGGDRTADAVAMGLWPSRGLELHGFEIKVSRGDWLREMHRPAKADKMFRYFDRWWLAVSDAKIVGEHELPPTWGLIVMDKIVTSAPLLKAETMTRGFLAAIMRRVAENSPEAQLAQRYACGKEDGHNEGYEAGAKSGVAGIRLQELRKTVAEFEQASGVSLQDWRLGDVGQAVQALRDVHPGLLKAKYLSLRDQLANVVRGLDDAVAAVGELDGRELPTRPD